MKKSNYHQIFTSNPKGAGESVSQYYQRISKLTNTSVRTIERHYPSFSKQAFALQSSLKIEQALNTNETEMHIVLPDIHIPFENQPLLENIVKFLDDYKEKIAGFHIIGDYLDMLGLSKHYINQVPMKGYDLSLEYELGNTWLDIFEESLKSNCVKSFLYGNHEDRYFRHFKDINQSVLKGVLASPTEALKLKERGFQVYENWQEDFIRLGKLQLIHGNYLGVNPCRQHLTRMKNSVMFGHSHRMSSYFEGDQAAFNIGCLVDIESEGFKYTSRYERMNWKNGFAVVYVNKYTGDYQADVIHCLNNSFSYGGKQYVK